MLFHHLQLNLKQAQAVKFLTNVNDAMGYDDSLATMYQLTQDSKLANYLASKNTVATVFAPVDDVSTTYGTYCALLTSSADVGRRVC